VCVCVCVCLYRELFALRVGGGYMEDDVHTCVGCVYQGVVPGVSSRVVLVVTSASVVVVASQT